MHTLIVINGRFLTRRITGVERYAGEILRCLEPSVRVVKPIHATSGLAGQLWEQFRLPGLLKPGEVLWSPANTGPLWVGNQVLTLHDLSAIEHPEWYTPAFSAWYRFLLPRLARRVRRVITVSEFSRCRILSYLRLPEEKVVCIPAGVDRRHFHPVSALEKERVRERYRLGEDYLLVVATLDPRKNLERLLLAWQQVGPRLRRIQLVITGGAVPVFRSPRPDFSADRVRWLGYVDDHDLPALYGGALAFILPSLQEGFGLSVLEAMACETPVIVANTGALPELVGEAGCYFDPLNLEEMKASIEQAATDKALRQELRSLGTQQADLYSWEKSARAVWKVLQGN